MKILNILGLFGLTVIFWITSQKKLVKAESPFVANKLVLKEKLKHDTLTVIAVGDLMLGSNYPNCSDVPINNGVFLLKPFEQFLKQGDIVFGNIEGTFLNKGGIPKGSGNQVYCFRQPLEMAKILKEKGFNLLSVANNHANDFGERGLQSTDSILTNLNIAFAGSLAKPETHLKIKNINIGFTAFAPHKGCQDMNDIENAEKIVRNLKKANQIVIVSFHGGSEGEKNQHVTKKTEIFYGQNRGNVYQFAHRMIDAGADIVIGHGPHVVRAVELYNNKFIAYSLGNFCT
jgi:poly-gamma-glutamate capsule biosynthesis protein CapA/YwtB (metallophosphatase superfamily)